MTSRDELVLKGPHLLSAGITVNKQSLPVLTTFSSMPKRNVFGKSEAVNSDGVSLHIFPEDEETKKLRIQFVQNTRRDSNNNNNNNNHFIYSWLKHSVF